MTRLESNPINRYADLISKLSIPRDRLNDHEWIYHNIEEINPFRKKETDELKLLIKKFFLK